MESFGAAPKPTRGSVDRCGKVRWLVSRYLYNRFGTHDRSWEKYKNATCRAQTVGEAAGIAAVALHA